MAFKFVKKPKRTGYQIEHEGRYMGGGATQQEAREDAIAFLLESFDYAVKSPVVRVAGDGTVFVFSQPRRIEYRIDIYRAEKWSGAEFGQMRLTGKGLEDYADNHVKQYNECTGFYRCRGCGREEGACSAEKSVCKHCGLPINRPHSGPGWYWIHDDGFYGCFNNRPRKDPTHAEPQEAA